LPTDVNIKEKNDVTQQLLAEILKEVNLFKKEYTNLMMGHQTVDELWCNLLFPFLNKLTTEYRKIIGETNSDSLTLLSINLSERFDTFSKYKEIGNENQARVEKKNMMVELGKTINKLDDVRNDLSVKDYSKQDYDPEPYGTISVFLSKPTALNEQQLSFYAKLQKILTMKGVKIRNLGSTDYSYKAPILGVKRVLDECYGAIILGMKQVLVIDGIEKQGTNQEHRLDNILLPTPWNHIEAGMASMNNLPLLIICEEGVIGGVFDNGITDSFVHRIKISTEWLDSNEFIQSLNEWYKDVINTQVKILSER